MRRYPLLALGIAVFFLVAFAIALALDVPLLSDPMPALRAAGAVAGVAGVALLIADVVLPVPSSLVMIGHGALFGVWWGAALSLVGSVGASLVGFAIGRAGRDTVRRFVTDREYERAAKLLDRWGTAALVATRPVPIVAETVAILAGASPATWTEITIASVIGAAPAAILYAIAGSMAARAIDEVYVFAIVIALSVLMWMVGRAKKNKPRPVAT